MFGCQIISTPIWFSNHLWRHITLTCIFNNLLYTTHLDVHHTYLNTPRTLMKTTRRDVHHTPWCTPHTMMYTTHLDVHHTPSCTPHTLIYTTHLEAHHTPWCTPHSLMYTTHFMYNTVHTKQFSYTPIELALYTTLILTDFIYHTLKINSLHNTVWNIPSSKNNSNLTINKFMN